MDRKLKSESAALLLLLAAFPIVSLGASQGSSPVWWLGLLCAVAGGVLPVCTRYMDHTGDKVRDAGVEFDDRVS